jgi:hypothetical protein
MNKLLKIAIATSVVALIAACGGGGGSAGTSPFGAGAGAGGVNGPCPAASAASGAAANPCATAASLTLQLDTASIQNTGAATVKATATATTSSGQALSGIPVAFSVDNGATFTQSATTTAADGTSVATVAIGANPSNRIVTVTATSGSLTATGLFAVTGATLTGTRVPAVVLPGSTNNRVDFRLVDANGKAMVGQAIDIAAGSLGTTSGTTGVNGDYSYLYTAPTATGNLDVVATAGGVTNTQTVLVQSTAGSIPPVTANILSASVSANPSVVSTNSASTSNRTELRALFVGASNAPIGNVRVRFDLNGDPSSIGGTFSTGSNIVYSDASGIATSAYIPGTRSSPTNGVTIRACYDKVDFAAGACPNSAIVTITVVADPLSVTIGSNALIVTPPANLTYQRKFVVLVVDASGRAKANVDIVPSVDIDQYWKGFYDTPGTWTQHENGGGCQNEDLNRNGVLEGAEDVNHSAAIEPRKSDVAISIAGNGKTDDSGSATVTIEYPQNVGSWARVKILIAATGVSGTEGRATWTEILPVPASALTAQPPPPFAVSPYGTSIAAETILAGDPRLSFDAQSPPQRTRFPDGTVPVNPIGGILPCNNPY